MLSTQSNSERGIVRRGTENTPEQKILELLKLSFIDPNDPELYVRRQQLKKTFQLLEPSRAAILHSRLIKRDPKYEISRLFHKLATATRTELLAILEKKIKTQRQTNKRDSSQSALVFRAFKNPTKNPRYIDNLFQFVGWNVILDEYYLDWKENGKKITINVPKNTRIHTKAGVIFPDYEQVYPNEFSALLAVASNKKRQPWVDRFGALAFAFYHGLDNTILPTIYSPDTTPRFFKAIAEIKNRVTPEEIAESHIIYYSILKDAVNPFPFDIDSEGEIQPQIFPKVKKTPKLPKTQKKAQILKVKNYLRKAGIKLKKIDEVKFKDGTEPIFETANGWIVASYRALSKYRKSKRDFNGWDAHHILENRHLQPFPYLISSSGWTKENMPCVLLPKNVHNSLAGDLSHEIGKLNLQGGFLYTPTRREIFEAYQTVYKYIPKLNELLPVVKKMLGL